MPFRLFKKPDPSTYGINILRKQYAEMKAKQGNPISDFMDRRDDNDDSAEQNERGVDVDADATTGAVGGVAAVAGVGALGLGGAAAAACLSQSAQKKVASQEMKATEMIAAVDTRAMDDVASIYAENNVAMETPSATTTTIGCITAPLAIVGAGAVAAKTKMGSLDIARIAKIEKSATDEMKSIDSKATDKIASIHEKEGIWFDRPGGSRAAQAAAVAGLNIRAVKKIATIEEGGESQMDLADSTAAEGINAASKKHAFNMAKYTKQPVTLEFWNAEEEAVASKYAMIEEQVLQKTDAIDKAVEGDVAVVYQENGKTLEKDDDGRGYFTARGAAGAPATAAAIAAASRLAVQRKENLVSKSRSAPVAMTGDDGMFHLGIYDLGAGVAAAGKALTGIDLEGPTEYDARSHWTPEQRARTCCA